MIVRTLNHSLITAAGLHIKIYLPTALGVCKGIETRESLNFFMHSFIDFSPNAKYKPTNTHGSKYTWPHTAIHFSNHSSILNNCCCCYCRCRCGCYQFAHLRTSSFSGVCCLSFRHCYGQFFFCFIFFVCFFAHQHFDCA